MRLFLHVLYVTMQSLIKFFVIIFTFYSRGVITAKHSPLVRAL